MKEWNDYLKTLIFVETSTKPQATVRKSYERAAEKGVTNVKLDNGGATLVGVTFDTYKAMADLYGWPSTWEGFVTMTFEEWERIVSEKVETGVFLAIFSSKIVKTGEW
jgi:hypothetical protein